MPKLLAKEIRRRFAYAIDENSVKFMPILSAATMLHPNYCNLLPDNLFETGKKELKVWINRVPPQEQAAPNSVRQSTPFNRLSNQRSSIESIGRRSNRFV